MPTYRVKQVGAGDRMVEAARVVHDGATVAFERSVHGRWETVLTIPAERVESVQRRVPQQRRWRPVRPAPMSELVDL